MFWVNYKTKLRTECILFSLAWMQWTTALIFENKAYYVQNQAIQYDQNMLEFIIYLCQ